MSVEAHSLFERITDPEERIRGVECAAETVVRLRQLIEDHKVRLRLERKEKTPDLEMIRYLKETIREFEVQIESMLAFLKEFDLAIFQKMKGNN